MTRLACALLLAAALQAQAPATPAPFHWHDDYTEYHLLAPGSHSFHIVYFLNQRQPGLTYVLNQTRSGSEGSGIAVSDPRTGEPLKFDYLTGRELAEAGVPGRLNADEHYIRAHLPRPVPAGGEGRVRIEKTYKDEKSYFSSGETITFARSLGIGRNAIVLPAGYKLVSSNVAAIAESLQDGRLRISFENINGYASDVNIRAAKSALAPPYTAGSATPAATFAKTLYELHADRTVKLTHEFVAGDGTRDFPVPEAWIVGDAGPEGSMKAFDMDLGIELATGTRGRRHPPIVRLTRGDRIRSAHIRVSNTFRDTKLISKGNDLQWTRELFDPRATIVLPGGYELVHASAPVTAGTLPDGRVYLQVVNNRAASSVPIVIRATK